MLQRCLILLAFAACSKSSAPADSAPSAERGKSVYLGNCVACHAADPAKDGAIGPAVKGSSKALLQARVLSAAYPEGYTPKRATKAMTPLPHLGGSIDDLAEYLK